jgi:hypothetical protein
MPRLIAVHALANAHRRLRSLQPRAGRAPEAARDPPRCPPQFHCPYCTLLVHNESGRARHILSTPACAAAQARDVERARVAREEARRVGLRVPVLNGVTLDDAAGAEEDPALLFQSFEPSADAGGPLCAASPSPPHTCTPSPAPRPTPEPAEAVDDGECGKEFIERFPDERAGKPINETRAEPMDLRAHMLASGHMANPVHFEVAKLLLSSKMTDNGRDAHLKSRKVSIYTQHVRGWGLTCFPVSRKHTMAQRGLDDARSGSATTWG